MVAGFGPKNLGKLQAEPCLGGCLIPFTTQSSLLAMHYFSLFLLDNNFFFLFREDMNGLLPAPSTRSRLQGLKQMSVEKIAIIRQKLAETRSKTTTSSLSTNSNVTSRRGLFSGSFI